MPGKMYLLFAFHQLLVRILVVARVDSRKGNVQLAIRQIIKSTNIHPQTLRQHTLRIPLEQLRNKKRIISTEIPLSNNSKNSAPVSKAWILCGFPARNNHTSPACKSSKKDCPLSTVAVMCTAPSRLRLHSFAWCQCSSRYAFGPRYMSTPAIASATGSRLGSAHATNLHF